MMKLLRNEKGIALVMVLVFALIGLAIVSAMLFMLTQGTKTSGALKVYKSVDEAGLAGTVDTIELIKTRGLAPGGGTLPFGAADPCLLEKLNACTGEPCLPSTWASCTINARKSVDPVAEDPNCPLDPGGTKHICADMIVDLPGPLGTSFRAYTKIVSSVLGNTDTSGLVTGALGGPGVVQASSGQVSPPTIPYLYKLEVETQNKANPSEKADFSALYAF